MTLRTEVKFEESCYILFHFNICYYVSVCHVDK
jgi:hypothetical protein